MNFLILLGLLIPFHSFASGCQEVNLVTQKNSPFQKIPVLDQDGLGICYAYAASQLVDYELIKKGQTRSTHPLWLALKYAEKIKASRITSGTAAESIVELRANGNCPIDKVSKSLALWAKEAKVKEAELLGFIERLVPKINNVSKSGFWMRAPFSFELEPDEMEKILNETIKEFKPYCSYGSSFENLLPQIKNITSITSREILSSLLLRECVETTKLNISEPVVFYSKIDDEFSEHLKNKLNSTNAPLSISYCSKALTKTNYRGVQRRNWTSDFKIDSECGTHESLIVGKKLINGQCHFLLRNSWGSGFNSSTKNWKCLCKNKKTGAYLDNCENTKDNNGTNIVEGCWISESAISKNTYRITNLSKK